MRANLRSNLSPRQVVGLLTARNSTVIFSKHASSILLAIHPKIFKRVVKKEERPGEIPAAASRSIQEIIRLSWAQNPRHRPHAKQISSLLTLELEAMERASGAALPPSPSVAAEARSPPQPPSRTPNVKEFFTHGAFSRT